MNRTQRFTLLYFALLLLDVYAQGRHLPNLHLVIKPLLMPVLLAWIWFARQDLKKPGWTWIAAGLGMAWLGDVLLLGDAGSPGWFIGGLLAFLCTHLLYIVYFIRQRQPGQGQHPRRNAAIVVLVGYGVMLVAGLWSGLGAMKIPVVVYTIVITLMALAALSLYRSVPTRIWGGYCLGALWFLLSDSLLAVNRFYTSFAFSGALIMLTYGLAQWLITYSCVRYHGADEPLLAEPADPDV